MRGLLLISGGIDSPVAGYLMIRNNVDIVALHFNNTRKKNSKSLQTTKKLVKKAIKLGLGIDARQKAEIIWLGDAIRDRYLATGSRGVLPIESLYVLCLHLHKEIGPAIYQDAGIKRQLPPPG